MLLMLNYFWTLLTELSFDLTLAKIFFYNRIFIWIFESWRSNCESATECRLSLMLGVLYNTEDLEFLFKCLHILLISEYWGWNLWWVLWIDSKVFQLLPLEFFLLDGNVFNRCWAFMAFIEELHLALVKAVIITSEWLLCPILYITWEISYLVLIGRVWLLWNGDLLSLKRLIFWRYCSSN